MINYTDLTNYLVEVAERNPNLQFVSFDTDVDAINDPNFVCPAMVISPMPTILLSNSVVNYGFQLLYMDKMNQEEDNYNEILEAGLQNIIAYLEIVNIDYKIMYESGISVDPVIMGYEGGTMIGQQTTFYIQEQYNLDKFNSPYYEL